MTCHGWVWALCWLFGGIVLGCIGIVFYSEYRTHLALHILREDILRDKPRAFKGQGNDRT